MGTQDASVIHHESTTVFWATPQGLTLGIREATWKNQVWGPNGSGASCLTTISRFINSRRPAHIRHRAFRHGWSVSVVELPVGSGSAAPDQPPQVLLSG